MPISHAHFPTRIPTPIPIPTRETRHWVLLALAGDRLLEEIDKTRGPMSKSPLASIHRLSLLETTEGNPLKGRGVVRETLFTME